MMLQDLGKPLYNDINFGVIAESGLVAYGLVALWPCGLSLWSRSACSSTPMHIRVPRLSAAGCLEFWCRFPDSDSNLNDLSKIATTPIGRNYGISLYTWESDEKARIQWFWQFNRRILKYFHVSTNHTDSEVKLWVTRDNNNYYGVKYDYFMLTPLIIIIVSFNTCVRYIRCMSPEIVSVL